MINLSEALPLDAPITVLADPSGRCPLRCLYCPTGTPELLPAPRVKPGHMDFVLFLKIVLGLKEFGTPIKNLYLFRDGEPTANPRLPDMVRAAKGAAESIETTTNGVLMTRDLSRALLQAGLDHIRFSIQHVTDEGYRRIARTKYDYGHTLANVRAFREERDHSGSQCTIHAKLPDTGLSAEEKQKFFDDFAPIADTVALNSLFNWPSMDTQLGQSPDTGMDGETPLKRDRRVCPSAMKTMSIAFNGEVSVCCVAGSAEELIVGNVATESLVSIWRGEKMRAFRLKQLRGERETIAACASCQYFQGYGPESDLDAARERLIGVYK